MKTKAGTVIYFNLLQDFNFYKFLKYYKIIFKIYLILKKKFKNKNSLIILRLKSLMEITTNLVTFGH